MIQYISKPLNGFLIRSCIRISLLFAAIAALIVSNTELYQYYIKILSTYLNLGVGSFGIKLTILHWINDVLMAVFSFLFL